ncbi:MAG: CpsD/CapB family tyrosine-protein kinase [Terracidiphilus sp.]
MSQIFDALQRSEAERAGSGVSGLSGVTELLRLAERQGASKWDKSVLIESPNATESANIDNSIGMQAELLTSKLPEALLGSKPLAVDESSGAFDRIRSLSISLPARSRLVCLADGASPAAEAFRYLGVRLRHLRRDRPLKKVLITSTIPQEGKSMVAGNLACALAQENQQRTLLLEGDVRRPTLSQLFGLSKTPGVCEWMQSDRDLATCIYQLENPGLWIMPAGVAPSHPLELLQSGKLPALMDQLTAWFDWIVIDSPPVLPFADTSVWARQADGILLVTRQGITKKRQLKRGLEALEPSKMIGAILNGSKNTDDSGYYYYGPVESKSDNSLTE